LPCVAVVGPGVVVEESGTIVEEPGAVVKEPSAGVVGLSGEVCVPIVGCAIVAQIN
jgi:hypothetical protein